MIVFNFVCLNLCWNNNLCLLCETGKYTVTTLEMLRKKLYTITLLHSYWQLYLHKMSKLALCLSSNVSCYTRDRIKTMSSGYIVQGRPDCTLSTGSGQKMGSPWT